MTRVLVATSNRHKVAEIGAILGSGYSVISLNDWPNAPVLVEDGATFEANAIRKVLQVRAWLDRGSDSNASPGSGPIEMVLADDSGLEVDVLNGAPGVFSARFASVDHGDAGNASDAANNEKLLRLMAGVSEKRRTARFRCVLAVSRAPLGLEAVPKSARSETDWRASIQTFEGMCEGRIGFAPSGRGGFGYDPLFLPSGYECTFAELETTEKNRISHRSRALRAVREALLKAP